MDAKLIWQTIGDALWCLNLEPLSSSNDKMLPYLIWKGRQSLCKDENQGNLYWTHLVIGLGFKDGNTIIKVPFSELLLCSRLCFLLLIVNDPWSVAAVLLIVMKGQIQRCLKADVTLEHPLRLTLTRKFTEQPNLKLGAIQIKYCIVYPFLWFS
jgi:hypothetical protein